MNEALGNVGTTVIYTAPVVAAPADGAASIAELVADMKAGKVDVLVILGGNPVFTAPADLDFATALAEGRDARAPRPLPRRDGRAAATGTSPEAHYLESWGDARAFDGTVSLIQPLIAPLYDGRQAIEVLAALNGAAGQTAGRSRQGLLDARVRRQDEDGVDAPRSATASRSRRRSRSGARAARRIHREHVVCLGGRDGARPRPPAAAPRRRAAGAMSGMEIVFRPDPTILDGRNANNGWLQELPKPLSKVTWDNVAYIGVAHGRAARHPDRSRPGNQRDWTSSRSPIRAARARLPVWVLPGTADDVVVVHFGYGQRSRPGASGTDVGHDVFGLRTSTRAVVRRRRARSRKTGERYDVASTQNHFAMEGRNPVRVVDADEYRANPKSVDETRPEEAAARRSRSTRRTNTTATSGACRSI